jgi:hypothetical protein
MWDVSPALVPSPAPSWPAPKGDSRGPPSARRYAVSWLAKRPNSRTPREAVTDDTIGSRTCNKTHDKLPRIRPYRTQLPYTALSSMIRCLRGYLLAGVQSVVHRLGVCVWCDEDG